MTRPHRFKLNDSVPEALRSPAALEADKEEDKLPDSLSPSQVEVGVANIIDTHLGWEGEVNNHHRSAAAAVIVR